MVAHVHQRRLGLEEREEGLPEVVEVEAAGQEGGLEVVEEKLARDARRGHEV